MPSPGYVANAVDENASDPLLALLTITHADLPAPIRLVRNNVDVVSRGNTYTAFPFELVMPGYSDGGAEPAQISIDNVDVRIVNALRAVSSPPSMLIELVLASALDTVEESLPVFKVQTASGNRMTISLDLNDTADDEAEPLVQWDLTPSMAPALHN